MAYKLNYWNLLAEGLKEVLVSNYEDINSRMEEGTVNRTVASTNMNATSSRAHTIVGIRFIQKSKNDAGKEMEKKSLINIVDLAGRWETQIKLWWITFFAPVKEQNHILPNI